MSKNLYWNEKHEILSHQWVVAVRDNDRRKQDYLYKKLHPHVQRIIINVSQRYYQVPPHLSYYLLENCTQKIFLLLSKLDDRGKAFSYIGTIAKNEYYEALVRKSLVNYSKKVDLEYVDDNDFSTEIEYSKPKELNPEQIQYIHQYLLNLISTKQQSMQKTILSGSTNGGMGATKVGNLQRQIRVIEICIEYLLRFEDFQDKSLAEFVSNTLGLDSGYISVLFRNIFGFGIGRQIPTHEYVNIDSNFNYIQDDYTPNFKSFNPHRRMKLNKLKEYQDFWF